MHYRKAVFRVFLVVCFSSMLSGCFLNAMLARVTVSTHDELTEATYVAIQSSATVSICAEGENFANRSIGCTYYVNGRDTLSSFVLITELGLFGVLIDPVILQIPEGAFNITGTFGGLNSSGNLAITEVSGDLAADVNTRITPEAGMKLVIVDFPDPKPDMNDQSYGYTLNFELPGNAAPVSVKALFAARVQTNGQTFYPPLLPCEADFANIPALSLPQSGDLQSVDLTPLASAQGCNGRQYQLSADNAAEAAPQAVPSLSQWALILLGMALAKPLA